MRPEKERTISYRITEKEWIEIEKRAARAGESPHQWARSALLEKLNRNAELMPAERLLFQYLIRAQYLVTQGFQLLADHAADLTVSAASNGNVDEVIHQLRAGKRSHLPSCCVTS